jgi:hypothetical protein
MASTGCSSCSHLGLGPLTARTSESRPTPLGPLATRSPPPKKPPPSSPQVAALFGAACSASVNRSCAGQLALHMALTVRLQHLSCLALGLGIAPHPAGVLQTRVRTQTEWEDRERGKLPTPESLSSRQGREDLLLNAAMPAIHPAWANVQEVHRPSSSTWRRLLTPHKAKDQEVRQPRGPPPQRSNASIHPARGKQSGVPPTARTPPQHSNILRNGLLGAQRRLQSTLARGIPTRSFKRILQTHGRKNGRGRKCGKAWPRTGSDSRRGEERVLNTCTYRVTYTFEN